MQKSDFLLAVVLVAAAAGATFDPAVSRADEVYQIDGSVWDDYRAYLRKVGSTRPGAFAITADGTGSYSIWCQQMQCIGGTTYSHDAKQYCERDSGQDCVVFAVRDEIRVQYEIRK